MKTVSDHRLYLVYVHYGLSEGRDWKMVGRTLAVNYKSVMSRLAPDVKYLREVLAPRQNDDGQTWEGFAFIFLDPGWTDLVRGMQGRAVRMGELGQDLSAAREEIARRLEHEVAPVPSCPQRERIVTAGNLIHLLGLLDAAAKGRDNSFHRLFVGGARTLRYDAPKIIEAVIRIANIGGQLPLFRFDDDVIFFGCRSPDCAGDEAKQRDAATATANSIMHLCARYHALLVDPRVLYFMYSGGYEAPFDLSCHPNAPPLDQSELCRNDPRLLNGFATRVLQLTELPESRNLHAEAAMELSVQPEIVVDFLKDLCELGANPFRQVVSGAGLCLSDGAILDLPPYSNMQLNVMWIDDHLKYALHDELGHFGHWTRTHHPYVARVRDARFSQLRHARDDGGRLFTYNDVRWHIRTYMLRLILGCVADAWLRKVPGLKLSASRLPHVQYEKLAESVPGIYGDWFLDALTGTWADDPDAETSEFKWRIKQELWKSACARMNKLVEVWSTDQYRNTFLGLFVHGLDHKQYRKFEDCLPEGMPRGLSDAVKNLPEECPQFQCPQSDGAFREPPLEKALLILADDFVEYLSLAQFWPIFVHSVRWFLNHHAQFRRPDLEWMLPPPETNA